MARWGNDKRPRHNFRRWLFRFLTARRNYCCRGGRGGGGEGVPQIFHPITRDYALEPRCRRFSQSRPPLSRWISISMKIIDIVIARGGRTCFRALVTREWIKPMRQTNAGTKKRSRTRGINGTAEALTKVDDIISVSRKNLFGETVKIFH